MEFLEEDIIDISLPLDKNLPTWPGDSGLQLNRIGNLENGDLSNETKIEMSVHVGTHIDAPLHFMENGKTIDQIPLSKLNGQVHVVLLENIDEITATDLEKLNLPVETKRILFKTKNSKLYKNKLSEFVEDFVGLTADAARWVVEKNIELVGIDYLSVASFKQIKPVHQILLENEVIIIEGLNLVQVEPGEYQMYCLPLKLTGVEAAPARVILQKI